MFLFKFGDKKGGTELITIYWFTQWYILSIENVRSATLLHKLSYQTENVATQLYIIL